MWLIVIIRVPGRGVWLIVIIRVPGRGGVANSNY